MEQHQWVRNKDKQAQAQAQAMNGVTGQRLLSHYFLSSSSRETYPIFRYVYFTNGHRTAFDDSH